MAREILEGWYFDEMERAMAGAGLQQENDTYPENCSPDIFDAIKRKLLRMSEKIEQNYSSMFQAQPVSGRRKGSRSAPEDEFTYQRLLKQEHIEMAQLGQTDLRDQVETARGHDFIPQKLTEPTWCDQCGDFIWGVGKQCRKCRNCQYTCHLDCLPAVTLDCKSVLSSPDEVDNDDPLAETSLHDPPDPPGTLMSDGTSDAANDEDETDSGYRSGTIPDDKLPKMPSQATLNREEIRKKIDVYNTLSPGAEFYLLENAKEKDDTFQGFLKVTLNLVRPISMSLGARPPSIYEILTKEHIVEQNTQNISFYMPRDTVKSIHVSSEDTTREVITALLKKFHILDHPRKFAMYEQTIKNGKIDRTKLRRVVDKESPLQVCLSWNHDDIHSNRLVLQENETGEIVWENFSLPELQNFHRVLNKEEEECISELRYKYKVMKRIINQRLKELRKQRQKQEVAANGEAEKQS